MKWDRQRLTLAIFLALSLVALLVCLTVAKKSAPAYADQGMAYYREGREKEAVEAFGRALAIDPNYHQGPLGLGLGHLRAGEWDRAIRLLALVAQHRPNDVDVRYNLAIALMRRGLVEDAVTHFGAVVKLNPKDTAALNNMGLALTALRKLDDAVTCFQAALKVNPKWAEAHNNLGIVYEAQGKVEEALAQYDEAGRLQPERVEAWSNLGLLLMKEGRLDEATPFFKEWAARKPQDSGARFYYGLALLDEEQPGPALVQLRESVRLRPDWASSLQTLARILATYPDPMMRNGAEAVQLAERGCELTRREDALLLDTLAAAYAEAGRFPEAIKTAEEAVKRAAAKGQGPLALEIRQHLELYRQQKPFHQEPG